MLHIKLTGMKQRTPGEQIFCSFTHPRPLDKVKRSKQFFSEGHVQGKKFRTCM